MNKMHTDDIKARVKRFICNTIDLYMPTDTTLGKIQNATAKMYVSNNYYNIEKVIDAFADENGEIDVDEVIETYETMFDANNELKLNVKEMIPDSMEWVKSFLPNKLILFKKGDLHNIFS